jgi:hypothetical protein
MSGIIYTPAPTPPTPPTPPGAPDRGLQYNASGTFAGLALLSSDTNGDLAQYIATSTPSPAPPQNNAILYADVDEGDEAMSQINSWGKAFPLQNNIGHKILAMAWPGIGTSPVASFTWANVLANTGTWQGNGTTQPLAQKTYNATFALPNFTKMNGQTTAAINNSAEIYMITRERSVIVGSASQAWGVKLILTFGLSTYKTDERIFMGYNAFNSVNPANTDPSTWLNSIGIIKDQADSNFNFYFRGAAGGTKANTGITPTLNGVYRATIFIPSSGGSAYISLQEITVSTVNTASWSNSATIPIPGTILYPHFMANTGGATGTQVNISLIQIYEEQL